MRRFLKRLGDFLFGRADLSPHVMTPKEFDAWKRRQDERAERVKQEAQVWQRNAKRD